MDIIQGLKEMGLLGTRLEMEFLVRELLGMRSRVALMLAKHISQLQLASFRHLGK